MEQSYSPSWHLSTENCFDKLPHPTLHQRQKRVSTLFTFNKWCAQRCATAKEKWERWWGEMRGRVQLIAWWWNFSISFIIKRRLSVIDLRRGVSESCGFREAHCSEPMHYSKDILTQLTKACQFLSSVLGVAATLYPPYLLRNRLLHTHKDTRTCTPICIKGANIMLDYMHITRRQVMTEWSDWIDCCFVGWSTSDSTQGLIYN